MEATPVQRRVVIKAEQIARMVVKGMKVSRIAIEMGMSNDGVGRILRNPDYLAIEEGIRKGTLARMDARLEKRAELGEDVEDAVPEALEVLLDAVRKKRDLKAALEVLDRDPQRQFAKGNASRQPAAQAPTVGSQPSLPADALDQAIRDADLTHTILQKQAKPAEA
jgi:hypothetical protein